MAKCLAMQPKIEEKRNIEGASIFMAKTTFQNRAALSAYNEVQKHHAAWCNQIASGVLGAGLISPGVASWFGQRILTSVTFVGFALCCFLALCIHILGQMFLRMMKGEDDVRS